MKTRQWMSCGLGLAAVATLGFAAATHGQTCVSGVGCQLPDQAGHGAGNVVAATSDLNVNVGYRVAEDFLMAETGMITDLCWWGIYHDFTAGGDCGPGPGDNFTVTYYSDDGGGAVPGTPIAGPFSVTPTVAATGQQVAGHAEYIYEASHSGVSVSSGTCYWVEVVNNTGNGNCFWLWTTAPPGDNRGAQDAGAGYAQTDYDLSFCINLNKITAVNSRHRVVDTSKSIEFRSNSVIHICK